MLKLFRFFLMASCSLCLASCYVSSVNPLTKESALDKSLLGFWESLPEPDAKASDKGYLLFLEDQNGMLDIIMYEEDFKFSEHYRGFCSVIAGEKFLNVKPIKSLQDGINVRAEEEFYIVNYTGNGRDEINLQLLNEEFFQSAVQSKKIAGRKPANNFQPVVLTASAENLAVYFQENQKNNQFYRKGSIRIRRLTKAP